LEGQTLAPPPVPRRELDAAWLQKHQNRAFQSLSKVGLRGFMEVYYFSTDAAIPKTQQELLSAARLAQLRGMGRPMGAVLDRPQDPKPTSEGILAADISGKEQFADGSFGRFFDYWTLTTTGDFYTRRSLHEDYRETDRNEKQIAFNIRILRATEALLHCANLYKALGVGPGAHVEMGVRYGGLHGRRLTSSSMDWYALVGGENLQEDTIAIPPIRFRLGDVEKDLVILVKQLCEPLFVIFDYSSVPDDVYRQIIADFTKGRGFR